MSFERLLHPYFIFDLYFIAQHSQMGLDRYYNPLVAVITSFHHSYSTYHQSWLALNQNSDLPSMRVNDILTRSNENEYLDFYLPQGRFSSIDEVNVLFLITLANKDSEHIPIYKWLLLR